MGASLPPSGVVHATDALRVNSDGGDFGVADELFGDPVEYRVARRRRNPGRRAAPASQAARDRRRTAAAAYMHDTLYLTYHTLYLLRISLQFRYGADTEPDTLEAVRYKGTEVLE